jgi:hypothetical protein
MSEIQLCGQSKRNIKIYLFVQDVREEIKNNQKISRRQFEKEIHRSKSFVIRLVCHVHEKDE